MHIMPEQAESWEEVNEDWKKDGKDGIDFPIPYLLLVCGYTIILIIDKILFDTHAIFDEADSHGQSLAVEEARN